MIVGMSLESFIGVSSKVRAEQVARDAARVGGSLVIVNPSTPVGPGDVKPTPTGRMVLDAATGRTGRSPPRIRLPNAALLPIAYAAEAVGA